ncbi:hypothetical protein [Herbaspirillum sp. ST 5-3]|uniref:hypothetical protein n=1 Tax=Oxalobacteraceae TaxID=75682 RepID=UPI001B3B7075|nr:hypothetical protein [Herbaspirillum sp. ST 5-3]
MALDAIVEIVAKAAGQILGEVVVATFYWPGWLILRALTFGRYPPEKSKLHNKEFVAIFGLAAILVGVLLSVPGGGL